MARPKNTPGQRVRINEAASGLVQEFVGMVGHIGIGSLNAPAFYQGDYFVKDKPCCAAAPSTLR